MSNTSLFQQLKSVYSVDRLNAYRAVRGAEINTLSLYVWNIALCESLYPILNNLEIGLRNRVNAALVKSYSDPEWYDNPQIIINDSSLIKVRAAKRVLRDDGRDISPPRIIAELSFGFWTTLFSAQYHRIIWERPNLLRDTFPFMPKLIRKRNTLAGRFAEIRKLRNRVFHYEPIWRHNLVEEHSKMIEALGWLDPCLQKVTAVLDRFATVNTDAYRKEIKERLQRACPVESKLLVAARRQA